MTPQDALSLLKQVGANFQGNLQDHQKIQEALKVIEAALPTPNKPSAKQPPERVT